MCKSLNVLAATLLTTGLLSGCQNFGNPARSPSHYQAPDALAHERERETYVDNHYKQILKSGRVADESQARALAGRDYEAHERHRTDKDTTTARWSTRDKAIREQKQFEKELADMERD